MHKLFARNLGCGGYAVAAQDLAVALKDDLDRAAGNEVSGGLMSIAHLASTVLRNITAESVFRRIYEVRHGRNRTINAELAEAITVAVGDWHLSDLDIPTIPRGIKAAVEMVEAWADVHEVDEPDVLGLANKLIRFAMGYVATFEDVEGWIEAEAWDTHEKLLAVAAEATEEELMAA